MTVTAALFYYLVDSLMSRQTTPFALSAAYPLEQTA